MSDLFDKKKMTDPIGRPTARDLLVRVCGDEHATHAVSSKRTRKLTIAFRCTCGREGIAAATEETKAALRNVPEEAS